LSMHSFYIALSPRDFTNSLTGALHLRHYIENTKAPISCVHMDVMHIELNHTDYVEILVIGTDVYYITRLLSSRTVDTLREHVRGYGKVHSALRYQQLFQALLNILVGSVSSLDYGMTTVVNKNVYPDGATAMIQLNEQNLQQLKLADKLEGYNPDSSCHS